MRGAWLDLTRIAPLSSCFSLRPGFVLCSFFRGFVDSKRLVEFVPTILTSFTDLPICFRPSGSGRGKDTLNELASFGRIRTVIVEISASFPVRLEFVLSSFFRAFVDSKRFVEFVPTIFVFFASGDNVSFGATLREGRRARDVMVVGRGRIP